MNKIYKSFINEIDNRINQYFNTKKIDKSMIQKIDYM